MLWQTAACGITFRLLELTCSSCRLDVLQVKLFARDVREHTYFEKLVELLIK